jgi:hypothetical protein
LYASGYVLIIHGADQLLTCPPDPDGQMQSLVGILKSAGEMFATPIDMSCAWGRPSKPFHVIFQADVDKIDGFLLRLKAAGCDAHDINELYMEGHK